jgi:phosphatidylinositol alpha 1,6-mannosyltransferase
LAGPLRIALFTDSYQEANGVATLAHQLTAFARDRSLPFFCVHGGKRTHITRQGSLEVFELKRGLASFPLDQDLYCDPLFVRHKKKVLRELLSFRPDVVHITGPGDVGVLGFWVAHILQVPLAASWHTNLHEYASRRLDNCLSFAPDPVRHRVTVLAENQSLRALVWFYRLARFVMAPNAAMVDLLHQRTGKPAFRMEHGVDVSAYSRPLKRRREGPFRIGYVGRLTPEKNVHYFADLERDLRAAGQTDFEFLIVGEGSERRWLKKHIRNAELPGVLRGKELAAAFASMDAFVFPSKTDTFGLVILEAMASGVSVVVSPETGARVGISDGVNGFCSMDFAKSILQLMNDSPLRESVGQAAACFARSKAWGGVFEHLYSTYELGLKTHAALLMQSEVVESPAIGHRGP